MASPDRPPALHLGLVAAVAPAARRWGVFPLLRRLEAAAADLPRIGRSRLPSQNVVDLAQEPSLGFTANTIEKIETSKGRPRVSGYWLGLLGPMGPLPTHLTEYAFYEARYAKSRPFGRFLDLLAGRMLQFFYRAWADSQPAAQLDRPLDDRFAAYLAALTGATDAVDHDSVFPAKARLHYASLFASRRSAIGLQDGLSHLLRQPLEVHEYQPRWQPIEPGDRSRLGHSFCVLGEDALLGSQVMTVTDAFRVVIRAQSHRDYLTLMPVGSRFAIAAAALQAFAPGHLEWDIAVEIADVDAWPVKLDGNGRLGWTGWVGRDAGKAVRGDAHLRRTSADAFNRRKARNLKELAQ